MFPDGRRRLHLCGFQVPRELFTALAQALILFPLAQLYDGPFYTQQLEATVTASQGREMGRSGERMANIEEERDGEKEIYNGADGVRYGDLEKETWRERNI